MLFRECSARRALIAGNASSVGKRILDAISRREKHVFRSRRHQDCRQFTACCPTSQTGRSVPDDDRYRATHRSRSSSTLRSFRGDDRLVVAAGDWRKNSYVMKSSSQGVGRYFVRGKSPILAHKMARLPVDITRLASDMKVNRVTSVIVPIPDLMDDAAQTVVPKH